MQKIAVGISGSSGSIYAKVLLEDLKSIPNLEVGITMSKNALINWELENPGVDIMSYGFKVFQSQDFNAPFASGSASYDAMIVCPCSAGTMARIAHGISNDLMTRAADVMLKERKKLILVLRETPLNLIHIKNMESICLAGGVVCPAIPSFYSHPQSLEDLARTVSHRAMKLAGLTINSYEWSGAKKN